MSIKEIYLNNNTFIHKYIKPLLNKEDIVLDMTLGNGNDTYFISGFVNKIYGFDIDIEAIKRSKERCKDLDNIIYINDNFINVDKYIKEDVDLIIYNLGYLPNSNKKYITNASDTLRSFKKAYALLKDKGYIIITFYLGHKGGKDEYYLLDKYIKEEIKSLLTTYQKGLNIDEPITYIIQKHL